MKAAQVGATEAGNCWLGYLIDISPCPVLMVMPTDETVKRNSKIRIDPMIEATPRLRDKIAPARSRDSGNTVMQKQFAGGVLVMTGANSAVGLRSMPVRALMLDEVDGYPADLDGEGNPIDLARARTRTFARRKIFIISTPTTEGGSAIEKEFVTTDQRYWYVPCPICGGEQALEFDQLRWEEGKPETAQYECSHCTALIQERHKTAMLNAGRWVATHPELADPRRVGYHINSLYSPYGWYSWADAAREFEEAGQDQAKLKSFYNTVLGKTWKESGEVPAWEALYERRESYRLNAPSNEVYFITAGVDVQGDRLEIQIVGWGKRKRSWLIDYRVLVGDTAGADVWRQLDAILSERWTRTDGLEMQVLKMCVDSGFNTNHVYTFCAKYSGDRVVPIKGQENQAVMLAAPRPVGRKKDGTTPKFGGVKLWNIGVSIIKSELYGWLKQTHTGEVEPDGYCHFPALDVPFFRGLTAEQLEFKLVRGYRRYMWVKKYARNEPLDTRVYARAAAAMVGIDRFSDEHYEKITGNYSRKEPEKQRVTKKSGDFWAGW